MDKRQIIDTNFDTAKADMKTTDFIDNDIALYDDASKIQLPKEPRRTTFIFVGLCTAGTASYTIDTEEITVKKNDIVIISERRVTENYTASPDLECIGMFMSMNFYYETIRNVSDISAMLIFSRTNPVVSVSENNVKMFTNYFRILQSKTADTSNPFRRKVVQALVLAMFYDLNAIIHHMETRGISKRPRADIIFTEFIRLVEGNFKSERRVSWYAEQMCITPKYLAETVKQVSRRTPNEWIDNYVTLELRLKLKNSSKSIKEDGPRLWHIKQQIKMPTMDKRQIIDTNFDTAKADMKTTDFIDNDIALYDDASKIQLPKEPRRTTFIFVGLCTAGTASYTIDTEEITVKKNDIVIISERRVTENYTASPDLECIGMFMSMNFYYETIRNVSDISAMLIFSRTNPVVSVSENNVKMFTNYFRILQSKTADTSNPFRRKVVQALVLAMFYDLNAIIHHMETRGISKRPRADIIFTEFIRLVEGNFKSERRVSWYAEQMCITPKYLAETVKQVSRRTPNEWIDNYVTLELRLKLKNSSKSIKEIATDMHFPNQSFLGKYFKEHVGLSPSSYRKEQSRHRRN